MGNGNLLMSVLYIWSLQYSRCEVSDPCTKAPNNAYFCTVIPDVSLYPPKLKLLLFKVVSGIGTINNTVFNSSSLISVTNLTITTSDITSIEQGAFNSFLSLAVLNLEVNRLSTINASWFSNPASLVSLSLARNRIPAVEVDTLSHFSNLVNLDLSQNMISTIADQSFKGNLKLSILDLSNNKLAFLRIEAFAGIHPQKISLQANPWSCSCELTDLASFLRDLIYKSVLENGYSVTCNDPPNLKGIPVWNISDFDCLMTTSTTWPDQHIAPRILLPTLLGLLGLLVLLLLLVLLVKRKQDKKLVTPDRHEPINRKRTLSGMLHKRMYQRNAGQGLILRRKRSIQWWVLLRAKNKKQQSLYQQLYQRFNRRMSLLIKHLN
ncbi:leucine-rich repeat-containing protein 53-like [Heterodontus francisci]|uniref:leucine-rich repeat-containing protein 53-like n=1 Tax=Heterodontus francisci TaxID=7792 RepID=UPI00355B3520